MFRISKSKILLFEIIISITVFVITPVTGNIVPVYSLNEGVSFTAQPQVALEDSIQINKSQKAAYHELNQLSLETNKKEINNYTDTTFISNWTQIIGDYPHGNLDNGFNNSKNVATRGTTTFTVNDKEYLLFGTGNIVNSSPYNSVDIPFLKIATGLAVIYLINDILNDTIGIPFLKVAIKTALYLGVGYLIYDIISPSQITFNNLIVNTLDRVFKQLPSQGCELWYYDGIEWGQSVGSNSGARIGRGFNNVNNTELTMLTPFHPVGSNTTFLYAGTWNPREGCEVWRSADPINGSWEPVIYNGGVGSFSSGFGNMNNTAAFSAAVFDNWLYIGTMNFWNGCEIWRTNGNIWERVIGDGESTSDLGYGFGDDDTGFERDIYLWDMKVYRDSDGVEQLYVGTFNIAGCELWRTRNAVVWECLVGETGVLQRGFNTYVSPINTHNYGVRRMEVFRDSLYIGTASTPPSAFKFNGQYISNPFLSTRIELCMGNGGDIWRFHESSFTQVIGGSGDTTCSSGFGDKTNAYIWSLMEYDGCLFAGTMNPGVGVINVSVERTQPFDIMITVNSETDISETSGGAGCEIWYTSDGEQWHQIVGDEAHQSGWPSNGFGDIDNLGARVMNTFQDSLFVGITNTRDGCEIWRFNGNSYPSTPDTGVKQINVTFVSSNYTLYGEIYYPSNESGRYPGIVFCEGYAAYISAYRWLPYALAEKGYVTFIFDPPGLGNSEGLFPNRALSLPLLNIYLRFAAFAETPLHYFYREWMTATSDALSFLLEESPVAHLVDGDRVGLIGHSLGGITVSETAAQDDRVDAVVALSQANPFVLSGVDVPLQLQGGCRDFSTYSIPILLSCYKQVSVPKELIMIAQGTHVGFTTIFGPLCPCPRWQKDICLRYAVGWFDYYLKNDGDAYTVITTGVDHLSSFVKSRYNFGEGDHFLT